MKTMTRLQQIDDLPLLFCHHSHLLWLAVEHCTGYLLYGALIRDAPKSASSVSGLRPEIWTRDTQMLLKKSYLRLITHALFVARR